MQWEEKGSIFLALETAITRAKDTSKNPLTDLAIAPQFGRLADLMGNIYLVRDFIIAGKPIKISEIHGWKKVDEVHRQAGFLTNLDMELWQRGDAVVASVLSVKALRPIERYGDDIEFAVNKIAEWSKKYPKLIVVGHGDKGSTAVLAAAQHFQDKKLPIPPTLALEPFPPRGLALNKDAPVVGLNLTPNTFWSNWNRNDPLINLYRGKLTGFALRTIDASNIAQTGYAVADTWINSIDARAYWAALGIGAVKTGSDRDIGPVLETPEQPSWVRWFNGPSAPGDHDPRLDIFENMKKAPTDTGIENPLLHNDGPPVASLKYKPYDVSAAIDHNNASSQAEARETGDRKKGTSAGSLRPFSSI